MAQFPGPGTDVSGNPGGGGGGGAGGFPPGASLPALLQALGGAGFGFGGQLGGPYGGLASYRRKFPPGPGYGYPGMPQQGLAQMGYAGMPRQEYGGGGYAGTPYGQVGGPGSYYGQAGAGQQMPQLSGTAPPVPGFGDPNNYASTPLKGSDAEFWASHLLGGNLLYNLAQQGYLTGNPAHSPITEFLRQQAAQTSGAMQRRAQLAAQTSGLPYGQQGYGWLQGLLGGQGSEAQTINNSLAQQYQGQQDFARQLAGAAMGFAPQSKYKGPTDWGSVLGGVGNIAGSALTGGLFGGAGAAASGADLPRMGQSGFQYPYGG